MVMQRGLIGFFLCLMLSSCHWTYHPKSSHIKEMKSEEHHYVQVSRTLPSFVNVNIKVPVNVRLHTGSRVSEVVLSGDSHDVPLIETTVRNQTLYVTLGSVKPHFTKKKVVYGPIDIDIRMPTIHQFSYRGKGRIVGHNISSQAMDVTLNNRGTTHFDGRINLRHLKIIGGGYTEITGIHSDHLDIYLHGRPKVQLVGDANVSEIVALGAPKMSFYWLKSPWLKLRGKGKGGVIQIGGLVDKLDVDLAGNMRFDGRYIRAKETFVKTHQHAIAEIVTTEHQHTLALDASDIYFHSLPENNSNFMGNNGAVLDMRNWELQVEQSYSQYNKSE